MRKIVLIPLVALCCTFVVGAPFSDDSSSVQEEDATQSEEEIDSDFNVPANGIEGILDNIKDTLTSAQESQPAQMDSYLKHGNSMSGLQALIDKIKDSIMQAQMDHQKPDGNQQPEEPHQPEKPQQPEKPHQHEKPQQPEKPYQPEKPQQPEKPEKPQHPGDDEKPANHMSGLQALIDAIKDAIMQAQMDHQEPDGNQQPEKPHQPEKPQQPEKPHQPEKPQQPEKPHQPEKPQQPEKPEKPQNPGDDEKPANHMSGLQAIIDAIKDAIMQAQNDHHNPDGNQQPEMHQKQRSDQNLGSDQNPGSDQMPGSDQKPDLPLSGFQALLDKIKEALMQAQMNHQEPDGNHQHENPQHPDSHQDSGNNHQHQSDHGDTENEVDVVILNFGIVSVDKNGIIAPISIVAGQENIIPSMPSDHQSESALIQGH